MDGNKHGESSPVEKPEPRVHPRYSVDEECLLMFVNHGMPVKARIVDLSYQGCRLRACDRFTGKPGRPVEVTFKVKGFSFRFSGVVRWTDGTNLIGIRFEKMLPRRQMDLAEVIEEMAAAVAARTEAVSQMVAEQEPAAAQAVSEIPTKDDFSIFDPFAAKTNKPPAAPKLNVPPVATKLSDPPVAAKHGWFPFAVNASEPSVAAKPDVPSVPAKPSDSPAVAKSGLFPFAVKASDPPVAAKPNVTPAAPKPDVPPVPAKPSDPPAAAKSSWSPFAKKASDPPVAAKPNAPPVAAKPSQPPARTEAAVAPAAPQSADAETSAQNSPPANQPSKARERRSQARHEIDTKATIFLVKIASALRGQILDLSVGGCRIRTDERFPVGIYTRVETEFHLQGLPFRLGGVIQAIHDRNTVGIRFLDLSDRKRQQVAELIDEIALMSAENPPEDALTA